MIEEFQDIFSDKPEVKGQAHGLVNLIGGHTDYNGGFVLPTCIPQETLVGLRQRSDQIVRVYSLNMEGREGLAQFRIGDEERTGHWLDYFKGVTWRLRQDGFLVGGFDCLIGSTVPMGSGLSSSAALEMSLLKALNELFVFGLDPIAMACIGYKAENEFVGAQVGIMDHLAVSVGRLNEALFIDTRDLTFRRLPLSFSEMDLLVIDSGMSHSTAHGDYNQRRKECEMASAEMQVKQLRELGMGDLKRLERLSVVLRKRARHVITENARVMASVAALEAKDYVGLGRLFNQSHGSMRDDYEVSAPQIELLVELALALPEVLGARLTGPGFGGSVVILLKPGCAPGAAGKILPFYHQATNLNAHAFEVSARMKHGA